MVCYPACINLVEYVHDLLYACMIMLYQFLCWSSYSTLYMELETLKHACMYCIELLAWWHKFSITVNFFLMLWLHLHVHCTSGVYINSSYVIKHYCVYVYTFSCMIVLPICCPNPESYLIVIQEAIHVHACTYSRILHAWAQ